MVYAPIAITTLNRYEHLKLCIESLQRNPWAKKTDLFISVDFPLYEKHFSGYQKVVQYLKNGISGFNRVNIFYQEKNYGPFENSRFIRNKIYEQFDRLIFLEDDSILAPAFIEFCDRALEKYENDDKILGICGSNYVWCGKGFKPHKKVQITENDNNICLINLLGHGSAIWKKKNNLLNEICFNGEFYNYSFDLKKMKKLHNHSKTFFYTYLYRVLFSNKSQLPWYKGKLYPIDFVYDVYMLINDKYVVYPKNSLVRDNGMDGSGANYKYEADNKKDILENYLLQDLQFLINAPNKLELNTRELKYHDKYGNYSIRTKISLLYKYSRFLFKNVEKIKYK